MSRYGTARDDAKPDERAHVEVTRLAIPDVLVLTPRRFADERGWFEETWSERAMERAGLDLAFVQDNQSFSRPAGTVRGLHLQAPPFAQAKLVRVARGAIRDVAVDLRRGSPTYGTWVHRDLSEENGEQLLVPRGFAHGFCTLRVDTVVCYKVDAPYDRESERGVRFDDKTLAIDWGVEPSTAVLSEKDRKLPPLSEYVDVFD